MASKEQYFAGQENESLWKKSNAFKIGTGMTVVGVLFSLPVAALGLGVIAGSAGWHSEKNPFGGKNK